MFIIKESSSSNCQEIDFPGNKLIMTICMYNYNDKYILVAL